MLELTVLTNNPEVRKNRGSDDCMWVDGTYLEVLCKARDLIHQGYKLISHPLPASIRMLYSPYRTIILSKDEVQEGENSVQVIENSIDKFKFTLGKRSEDRRNACDYAAIDYTLFIAALQEWSLLKAEDENGGESIET